ncbi:hypothetical protein MTO96_040401 [Rhipicephalus appendiculatus]
MKMDATAQWKPPQAGLLISTTVVLRLQEVFLGNEGYEFFLTSRLLQDCLENLFSVVRLMKPGPTAYDLKCALRLVSVSQFLHTPRTTSYELGDRAYLVELLSQAKKQHSENLYEEIDDSEVLFIEELTATECCILYYLGGFILKSVLKSAFAVAFYTVVNNNATILVVANFLQVGEFPQFFKEVSFFVENVVEDTCAHNYRAALLDAGCIHEIQPAESLLN